MAHQALGLSTVLKERIRDVTSRFGEAILAAREENSGFEDILRKMNTSGNYLDRFDKLTCALVHFMLEEDALRYLQLLGFVLNAATMAMREASAFAFIIKAYKDHEYEISAGARALKPLDGSEPPHFLDEVTRRPSRWLPIVVPSGRLITIEHVVEIFYEIDREYGHETEEEICDTANRYIEVLTLEGLI